ncbi:YceI family protein [Flavobacterium sp. CYK-4]|uniref:YceI family protein n=1 Tax=Flavobacterium lotistagni TaxID=2709660 RepID=UPI00140D2678|nr:YceI family protein [Flavobacterium lotistagni]NHM06351.1 YceI family protein [Flavobacterium lotistagni]
MKKILIVALLLMGTQAMFSQKLMTRNGVIKFDASMPDLVEIAATNNGASCILDKATGDFVALGLVKSFKFKSPLMEEHFNENYMESSKFPKATFKGKILNFNAAQLSSKANYDLEGELTIHGVTKKIKTKIALVEKAGRVSASSNFTVKCKDYNIEIPSLVKEKFAENIKIWVDFDLGEK